MGSYILTSQNLNNTVLRLPNETWIKLYGNERHCRDIDFSKTAPNAEKISIKGSHLNRKPIQLGSKVTEINLSEVKQNFEKTAIKKIDISNIRFNSRTCI